MKKTDIVICAMPALFVDRLPGAPALLKAAVEEAGFTATTIDLSLDFLLNQCQKDTDIYNKLGCVFRPNEKSSKESLDKADEWLYHSLAKIQQLNPKLIGLSVFTNFQHRSTLMLAKAIRQRMPDMKIVLGGWGLTVNYESLGTDISIRPRDIIKSFGQFMQEKKFCDYTVYGSGLDELIKIIKTENQSDNKIVHYTESVATIYNTPIPNYDDYVFNDYLWNHGIALPVTGSKGCVRACTFCDIPGQFGKFKFRTGTDIANEMIQLHQRYNVKRFEFTDSLVNGSFKAFRQWLEILANYNDNQSPDNKIHWFGQYICRPQKHTPSDIYSLMKRSGVQSLVIGIESGSNDVLSAMQKKMTVQDAYDEFEMFESAGISAHVLMFGGFYNETWSRYLENLDFIIACQKYLATGTISQLSMGPPLYINDKMYLGQQADQLGIILDPVNELNWASISDPTNTFTERAKRRLIAQLILDKLKIPLSGQSISNMHQVYERLKNQLPTDCNLTYGIERDQSELDFLIPEEILDKINSSQLLLELDFESQAADIRWPSIRVIVDDEICVEKTLSCNDSIAINTKLKKNQSVVKIEYFGKTAQDTVIDHHGVIIANQHIKITKILVNKVDIIKHNLYTKLGHYCMNLDEQKQKYYVKHGYSLEPSHSLQMFENGYWQFNLEAPVLGQLVQLTAYKSPHEKWPNSELLFKIYNAINTSELIKTKTLC